MMSVVEQVLGLLIESEGEPGRGDVTGDGRRWTSSRRFGNLLSYPNNLPIEQEGNR